MSDTAKPTDLRGFVSRLTALEERELSAFERGFRFGGESKAFEVSELKAKLAKALGEVARLKRKIDDGRCDECPPGDACGLCVIRYLRDEAVEEVERLKSQLQARPPDGPAAEENASPGEGTHAHREPGEAPNLGGNGVAMVREIAERTGDSIQPNGRCGRHGVFQCPWCVRSERDELRSALDRANERNALAVALCRAVDKITPSVGIPSTAFVINGDDLRQVIAAREALRGKL